MQGRQQEFDGGLRVCRGEDDQDDRNEVGKGHDWEDTLTGVVGDEDEAAGMD